MITRITISNFKKLNEISFPISQSVVIIGPNNSGKSTVFQALCLWEIGVTSYITAKKTKNLNKNNAVTLNRQSLLTSPIANARFLWRDQKFAFGEKGKKVDVKLKVTIDGETEGVKWTCKTEFTYYNEESFSCKVLSGLDEMTALYEANQGIHFGFLQPMSGITSLEDKLPHGAIDRRLGEGKTAEVLRNICYEVLYPEKVELENKDSEQRWRRLTQALKRMFGSELQKPVYLKVNGTIQLEYIERGIRYDISSGGRGFQQTLLLLAYMFSNPNTILLLDEPDAHLEVIRQREVFQLVNNFAAENNIQIIIASHSEVVLDEAADASKVIALIENQAYELNVADNPRSLSHIKKTLTEIGWEKYYLAKSKKHLLFFEGSTDLQMLIAFAKLLRHPVEPLLRLANVDYTGDNVPNTAVKRYEALKAFFPELKGLALFDKINKNLDNIKVLDVYCWQKRELENYFAKPEFLKRFAKSLTSKHAHIKSGELEQAMVDTIANFTTPAYLKDLTDVWWDTTKLSDDWLDRIFPEFYKILNLPEAQHKNYKKDYYQIIGLLKASEVDDEIKMNLDRIYEVIK